MTKLEETLKAIEVSDKEAEKRAMDYIDNLAKPIGSLGRLEEIAAKYSGITGKLKNKVNKKVVVVICADNGVCEEGVSAAPQSITTLMTYSFPKLITGVGVLSKFAGADIKVVDIGVKEEINHPQILSKKLMTGTGNIRKGPAMSRETAIKAIEVGISVAEDLIKEGYDLIGTGEMGIGNTTTSSAVTAALLGLPVEEVVGLGAGLTKEQYNHKIQVIKDALAVNKPNSKDVIDVICKVGGLDIAGMVGLYLAAARYKRAIVIDGLISAIAALCACRLNPTSSDYMFTSHKSKEKAVGAIFKELKMSPMLDMDMRLGEGSGCPLAFNIIEAALFMVSEMGSFCEVGIGEEASEKLIDIRE